MADWHVIPNWQEHLLTAGCWCNPARGDFDYATDDSLWRHRLANDGPSEIPEDKDPALDHAGWMWLVVEEAGAKGA